MARSYGPAYGEEGSDTPVWRGIGARINEYQVGDGASMWRQAPPYEPNTPYLADYLLQEYTMMQSQTYEAIAEAVNSGIDAGIEAANEGIDATVEMAGEMVNGAAEYASEQANTVADMALDMGRGVSTKHGLRNDEGSPQRAGEVHSTSKKTEAGDVIELSPVSTLNNILDRMVDEEAPDPEDPSLLKLTAWRVADGLAAWANGIQERAQTAANRSRLAEANREANRQPGEKNGEGKIWSTLHMPEKKAVPEMDRQNEQLSQMRIWQEVFDREARGELPERQRAPLSSAFSQSSGRSMGMDYVPPQRVMYLQPAGHDVPIEVPAIQMERYQMSLELIENIDFGGLQREQSITL